MRTLERVTVEQFEEMAGRGEFDPIEEHLVELIRGEIVPRFGSNPRVHRTQPHESIVGEIMEWSFEVTLKDRVRIRTQSATRPPMLDSVPISELGWAIRKDYSKVWPSPQDLCFIRGKRAPG